MDPIYEILIEIEKNRLEFRRFGNPNSRSKNDLDKEFKELLSKFYQLKDTVDSDMWAEYMEQYAAIDTEWRRKTPEITNNSDAESIRDAIKEDEEGLQVAFEEYIKAQKESDIDKCHYYDGVIKYYAKDLKSSPMGKEHFQEFSKKYKEIHSHQLKNSNPINDIDIKEKFNNGYFLSELNTCKTPNEVKKYIDSIVEDFKIEKNETEMFGSTGNPFSNTAFCNNGIYSGFISPKTKISNATLGAAYHIYDKDYLYEFAIGIRKMNLPENTNLLQYVMPFLDHYFGFPKDSIDRRDDTLYEFAVNNAEKFYKEHNIEVDEQQFGDAITQMQITGEYPISALKGKNVAQCVERGAIAQNILKVCGYNACIMFGETESRGVAEGHCWNSILDNENNMLLMDFSNSVYSYKDGKFDSRKPYYCEISLKEYSESINGGPDIESPDFHYENGKKVYEEKNRKYAVGRSIKKNNDLSNSKPKRVPFDDKRIANGILSFNPNELEIQENQLDK